MDLGSRSLPAAVYGKPGSAGRMPEGYGWFARHPDFPELAERLASPVTASFQWRSTGGIDRYDTVACWVPNGPEGGSGVVIRFVDAGADSGGRPHTVRAEAAYVDGSALADCPDLPLLLCASREALCVEEGPVPVFRLSRVTVPDQGSDLWLQLRKASVGRPVVVLTDPHGFRCEALRGAQEVVVPGKQRCTEGSGSARSSAAGSPSRSGGRVSGTTGGRRRADMPSPSERTPWLLTGLLALLLAMSVAGNVWLWRDGVKKQADLEETRDELEGARSELTQTGESDWLEDYRGIREALMDCQAQLKEFSQGSALAEEFRDHLRELLKRLEDADPVPEPPRSRTASDTETP